MDLALIILKNVKENKTWISSLIQLTIKNAALGTNFPSISTGQTFFFFFRLSLQLWIVYNSACQTWIVNHSGFLINAVSDFL